MSYSDSLLLTSGNGPDECRIALKRLVTIMEEEAKAVGLAFKVVSGEATDKHGPASAIVMVEGEGSDVFAKSFVGTVRFTFPSPVRPNHKRQNWFVGVFPIDDEQIAPTDVQVRLEDIRFETLRAGGPGGQHQNTTDSAVRAIHIPTGLVALSRDERSQHQNKSRAVNRINQMLQRLELDKKSEKEREKFLTHKQLERGNEIRHFKNR